jgi:hypothetical protein
MTFISWEEIGDLRGGYLGPSYKPIVVLTFILRHLQNTPFFSLKYRLHHMLIFPAEE